MSVEDEHPQAEEEESVRREEGDDQRIHNTNGEQGTGPVDEGVGGRGNRPHSRRRNLWTAVGAVAVVATSVVSLAVIVVRNSGKNKRRQDTYRGEAMPIQVASEELRREIQEQVEQQVRQQVEQQVEQRVEQRVEQQIQERVAGLEERHRKDLENLNKKFDLGVITIGVIAFLVSL